MTQAGTPLQPPSRAVGYLSGSPTEAEDEHFIFSGSQLGFSSRFQRDTPPRLSAQETSQVPPFLSLPGVNHISLLHCGQNPSHILSGCCGVSLATDTSQKRKEEARQHRLVNGTDHANPSFRSSPLRGTIVEQQSSRRVGHERKMRNEKS